ncbi:MAG TPA: right-handed parallel beta-helix repeat-containing protein [Phycisphaerae bacterium]
MRKTVIGVGALLVAVVAALGIVRQATHSAPAPASAPAGNVLYLDGTLSVPTCSTYDPATRKCGAGSARACLTIEQAVAAARPGTTIIFRGGTYTERLVPRHSGTAKEPVVFQTYPHETVTLTGSFDYVIELTDREYVTIEGLTVDKTGWLEAKNSQHITLRNNRFTHSTASGTTGNVRFIQSHHNRILNNTLEDGNDNLLLIDSDYNLVSGNTMRTGRHSLWGIRCGSNNVLRGNFFENPDQKIGEVYDCGNDTHAVPHKFDATRRNVIEGNTFAGTKGSSRPYAYNAIQYAGQHGIIRRNVFYRNLGGGIGLTLYEDEALHTSGNRVYHNVFYENECAGVDVAGKPGADFKDNLLRNNIFLFNRGCRGNGMIQISARVGIGFNCQHNDVLFEQPGQEVIAWPAGTLTLAQADKRVDFFSDNLEVEPQFIDATKRDFHLAAASPVLDAGCFLTRTTSAGSGTQLIVEDAGYFCDGFGIETTGTDLPDANGDGLLDGDEIQLQGQTRTARIMKIDYESNTLTLDRPLSWESGQGVSLAYFGAAPDMGAFEADR